MSQHALYVLAAYGVSVVGIGVLLAWVIVDQRARLRELDELDRAGVKRRSETAARP